MVGDGSFRARRQARVIGYARGAAVRLAASLVALSMATAASAGGDPVVAEPVVAGPAIALAGDTIEVGGDVVRLWGIDAPELAQSCRDTDGLVWPCGEHARHLLSRLIGTATVVCAPQGRDADGVTLAVCDVDGHDLGLAMVAFGFAVERPALPDGPYGPAQRQSAAVLAGIWSGSFVSPWEWRASQCAAAPR